MRILNLLGLLSVLLIAFPVSGEDIIVPDNKTIQEVIDSASDGDTIIVRDGVYSVYLNITKSITLRSENGTANCILEANRPDDVIEVHADFVTITGFTIRNGNDDGVDIEPLNGDPSDHVNITGNVFYNLYGGVQIEDSNYTTIMNNNISNVDEGIYVYGSSYYNLIVNNTISESSIYGINIEAGDASEIYLNRFLNNDLNARDCGNNHWNSTTVQTYTYSGNQYTNYTGNYWDDYDGLDVNGDGIGDTPYNISSCGGGGGGEGKIPVGDQNPASQSKDYYPMLYEALAPPSISNVVVRDVTNSSATISWTVRPAANNRILYSTNSGLSSPSWSSWDNGTSNPSITLSGLSAGTTYYFSVFSYRTDDESMYSNSSIGNFTTIRNPKVWYVDDDGLNCTADFTSIQDAVNASMDWDTIVVCNGTYAENVIVDRVLNLTGVENPLLDASNGGSGFTLESDGNVIQGFTISGGGILISGSDRNMITGNIFDASRIIVVRSSHNTIALNSFQNQTVYGYIEIEGTQYHNAFSNVIYGNHLVKHYSQSSMPAIMVDAYAFNTNISSNLIEGYGGIRIKSGSCTVANNVIDGYTPIRDDDNGIMIDHASNCQILNNTVREKYSGIRIDTSSSYAYSTKLTLRENNLQLNTYDFYFDAGEADDLSPSFKDFDHDIDKSNTVTGGAIYFLKNAYDLVLDHNSQPTIGFFACVNCKNVTLKNVGLSSNSHGILLYNTSNSTIESVGAYYNALAGMAAYHSRNITISNSTFEENGYKNEASGIFLGKSENVNVVGVSLKSNWCYGIELSRSGNNTIERSNITDNGPDEKLSPVTDDCYSGGSGIKLYNSFSNTIMSNHVLAETVPSYGSWRGGQKYGIHSSSSSNNLIYNNYFFNHSVNAYDTGNNRWNITPVEGQNIIGGPYLGGNYWDDYAGADTAGADGLGDTLLPYNSGGNIQNGGDYHPLTNPNPDFKEPTIYVTSPVEGRTYNANYVYLEVYSPDPDVYRWWYSLNGGANVSFTPNTTITGLSSGNYVLRVYANDTANNLNSTTVNFSISISAGGGGAGGAGGGGGGGAAKPQPPLEEVMQPDFEITITSPEHLEYEERELDLNFTSPVPLARASFILDDKSPVKIDIPLFATSGGVRFTRLSLGEHRIIVNGEDYYGRKGRGEVEFKIIPLTLTFNATGTSTQPRFVDDVAFSFFGRDGNYILQFEAKGDARIDVHVNQYFREGILQYNNLSGEKVFSFTPTTSYQKYEVPVSGENITADFENIISFISENAESGEEKSWEIRNVTLIPLQNFSFPQITVFTFDRAISDNETMHPYVKFDGSSEGYKAYIYLLTPEWRKLYYPYWTEDERPVDERYLKMSYYGKLPSALKFDRFEEGTYILVGRIADEFGNTVSLSTEKIYHSQKASVKLYVNREIFSEGQEILVEHMLTGKDRNGTLMVSLESPDGDRVYLPMLSEEPQIKEYNPIHSDHFIALNEIVAEWREGTYILRSSLYNESGELLDDDIATFDVCFKDSTVEGTYLRIENDTSPITLSRIRLIDFYTMELEEREISGNHYSYSLEVKPGKYYLTGEVYSGSGNVYRIPLTLISAGCGKTVTRNLELELLYKTSSNSSGIGLRGMVWGRQVKSFYEPVKLEGLESCSKPKVGVAVILDETALNMLRDDIKLLYGIEDYEDADKARVSNFIAVKAVELIRSTSPNVDVYNMNDLMIALSRGERTPELRNLGLPEYLYLIKISGDMQYYAISALLQEFPQKTTLPSTYFFVTEIINPLDNVRLVIQRTGDLRQIIDDFEIKRPVPPRDPRIEVKVVPDSVSPDSEESRKATIYAKVTDCRGKPAVWVSESVGNVLRRQEVYFQKETERGLVKSDWEGKISMHGLEDWEIVGGEHWVIGDTRVAGNGVSEDGVAIAKYTLKEGIEAGEDIVKVLTFGRGLKKASVSAVIEINGVKMEIRADSEIHPRQSTLVEVSLYEEAEDGVRKPIAGKSIAITRNQLLDGRLAPAGAVDASGNPITDENGVARLKYTAGEKEGLVRIGFEYRSDLGTIKKSTNIRVKEKEFVLFIDWSATSVKESSYTEAGSSSCRVLCCREDNPADCEWTKGSGSYGESGKYNRERSVYFTSQTVWKQGKGEERTTATYIISKYTNWEKNGGGGGSSPCSQVSYSSSDFGSYSGMVSDQIDANTKIIYEMLSGDLLVCIHPVMQSTDYPLYFQMKGSDSSSHSASGSSSWSREGRSGSDSYSYSNTEVCNYDGDPETKPCSFSKFLEKQAVYVETYPSVTGKRPFLGCISLEKVGEDRWEDVNGDYNAKNTYPGSGSYTYDKGYCQGTRNYDGSSEGTYEGSIKIRVVKK